MHEETQVYMAYDEVASIIRRVEINVSISCVGTRQPSRKTTAETHTVQ